MGMLRVMSRRGDDRVTWDTQGIALGEPEALEAVREAERIFDAQREHGATAFRVERGRDLVRIDTFDPQLEQIVMVPRVVGG
jgi:hypothetical protein